MNPSSNLALQTARIDSTTSDDALLAAISTGDRAAVGVWSPQGQRKERALGRSGRRST